MKKIIIFIFCISILFCGCDKIDSKKEKTTSNKEIGVQKVYSENFGDDSDTFLEHYEAYDVMEDGEFKSIRIVNEGALIERDCITKTSYKSGKLKNDKICKVDLSDYDSYLLSNVDNGKLVLCKDARQKLTLNVISVRDGKIVEEIDFLEVAKNLIQGNEGQLSIRNIIYANDIITCFVSSFNYNEGYDCKYYRLVYDLRKYEIIETKEYFTERRFISKGNKYSLCVGTEKEKIALFDNDTCEVTYIPENEFFEVDAWIGDEVEGGFNNINIFCLDDVCYLINEDGLYSFDLKTEKVSKLYEYDFNTTYSLYAVSDKEFYCKRDPGDDYDEEFKYEVLHIVLE